MNIQQRQRCRFFAVYQEVVSILHLYAPYLVMRRRRRTS
jgi:hypothetical protein